MSAPRKCGATVAFTAWAVLTLAGCGSSGDSSNGGTCSASTTFPASSLASMPSDASKLHVELRSAPYQPLISGLDCVELSVSDASTGAPIDGLSVTLTPWMTAMGHGASVTPQLTSLGAGRYVFTNVSLSMPGEWQLRTQFSGAVSDSVAPTFNVE